MPRLHRLISRLLCAALVPGCIVDSSGSDTQGAPTTATTSTTGSSLSGSATSTPGSASDGTASDSAPTMAATTLTGSGSGGSTGEPCTFLSCGDYPKPDCDPFAQDCPEGQKCAAVITNGGSAWDEVRCVDVIGTDKPGDPCTMEDVASGVDSCIKGAMCWEVDEQGIGYCLAQCTGTADAPVCGDKAACAVAADGAVVLCIPACNPLLQDCLNQDLLCYPQGDSFGCQGDNSGNEGQANDSCEFNGFCDPGLMCADAAVVGVGCTEGSMNCCTPFCKFPDGVCPNPDQQCVQYFDPMTLPPNDPWLDIGFCGITI